MHDPQKEQNWESDLHNELASEIKLFKPTGVREKVVPYISSFLHRKSNQVLIENFQNQEGWKGKLNSLGREKIRKRMFNN